MPFKPAIFRGQAWGPDGGFIPLFLGRHSSTKFLFLSFIVLQKNCLRLTGVVKTSFKTPIRERPIVERTNIGAFNG